MKNKKLTFLFIFFLLISKSSVFGQMNIDSLWLVLRSEDSVQIIENKEASTITYIRRNAQLSYQFSVTSNAQAESDVWGTKLVIAKLDSLGRPIEKRFYGNNGSLFTADMEPIIRIHYLDEERIVQTDFYTAKDDFSERITVQTDSLGREIELIGYAKNRQQTTRQTTEYQDLNHIQIKRYFNDKNALIVNKCGVSIWYVRFDPTNRFEVERRYYNAQMELVDCTHDDPELRFAYNVATQVGESNEWKMVFYTKSGKIVRSFSFFTEPEKQ
jgi:hypothetical protein